jgi:DNA-binding GntR family transcriptional regulator
MGGDMNLTKKALGSQFVEKHPTLREKVIISLRADLTTGGMQQGITYSIPMLAEKFGVSATPVREAVLDLTKEGLLFPVPNKGFRIVETSEETLRDITDIRLLIEVPVTIKIAETITQDQIDELRELALHIQVLAKRSDFALFIENDRKFHHQILELCKNMPLVEYADQLRSQTRIHGIPYLIGSGRLLSSSTEHLTLLDAMEVRDYELVGLITAQHINHTIAALNARHKDLTTDKK